MIEKRLTIISKAVDLYHQYGIKSVSMDDIARETGMSKKTLYQYVSNKNELVKCVVDYHIDLITDLLSIFYKDDHNAIEQHQLLSKTVMERFPRYNPSMLYDLRKYYPSFLKKLKEHKLKESYRANFSNLEKGKNEGFYMGSLSHACVEKVARSEEVTRSCATFTFILNLTYARVLHKICFFSSDFLNCIEICYIFFRISCNSLFCFIWAFFILL